MTLTTAHHIADAIISAATIPGHCDDCDRKGVPLYESHVVAESGMITYRRCGPCESKELEYQTAERAIAQGMRPAIEKLLGKLERLDRHELYEALQRMSLEVITA